MNENEKIENLTPDEREVIVIMKASISITKMILESHDMKNIMNFKKQVREIVGKYPENSLGESICKKFPEIVKELSELDEQINHFFGT